MRSIKKTDDWLIETGKGQALFCILHNASITPRQFCILRGNRQSMHKKKWINKCVF